MRFVWGRSRLPVCHTGLEPQTTRPPDPRHMQVCYAHVRVRALPWTGECGGVGRHEVYHPHQAHLAARWGLPRGAHVLPLARTAPHALTLHLQPVPPPSFPLPPHPFTDSRTHPTTPPTAWYQQPAPHPSNYPTLDASSRSSCPPTRRPPTATTGYSTRSRTARRSTSTPRPPRERTATGTTAKTELHVLRAFYLFGCFIN